MNLHLQMCFRCVIAFGNSNAVLILIFCDYSTENGVTDALFE